MGGAYLEDGGGLWLVNRNDEEIYKIDCFFGFSGRCIALLAGVAELAAQCDGERIDPITRQPKLDWRPGETVSVKADDLRRRLEASARFVWRGCMHGPSVPSASTANVASIAYRSSESRSDQDIAEIYATNEAYHWAGLLHLSRRVLNLPSISPQVQEYVDKIVQSLSAVRRGSTAESCLLFPIFSAGCEAQTEDEKTFFMERLTSVEGWGMQHVARAKALMRRVWEAGGSWEAMVDGEFFG
jgi:hypothetical protein